MKRLPIRWRVTLAFALALLIVLTAAGAFLYLRMSVELGQSLDRGLQARSSELGSVVAETPSGVQGRLSSAIESDESVAQVLRPDGSIVAFSTRADIPLLTAGQLQGAGSGPLFADRPGDEFIDEALRVLAAPVTIDGERFLIVVGSSLDEKHEALSSLLVLELIGLAAALVLSSAAGFLVAGLALRPVDAMRRQAQEISDQPDQRLPVPPVDDELGRLGETLNAMLDRLERSQATERAAIAKERRFVADASHELRTPLTVLKAEIEVALRAAHTVPELRAALHSAGEETDRLCHLAEELLLLAEADEGQLAIHSENVDVAGLLGAVASRYRGIAAEEGRHIRTDAPAELRIEADRSRLERALANLVDNALRHGEGNVELTGRRTADGVVLSVRDRGPGFPAEFRAHAFERFRRADRGRSGGGVGLGLAIVDAVARAHGGCAEAGDAEPGASVRISLPQR